MAAAATSDTAPPPMWVYRSATPKTLPINFEQAFRNPAPAAREEMRKLTNLRNELCRALDAEVTDAALAALENYYPKLLGVLKVCMGVGSVALCFVDRSHHN